MGSLANMSGLAGHNWYVDRFNARQRMLKTIPDDKEHKQIVWVDKAYNPTDLRASFPVPRHNPLVSSQTYKPDHEEILPHVQKIEGCIVSSPYPSTVATRCEDSHTLTAMLPTTGIPIKQRPPNWGTASGGPPILYNTRKHNRYHKFSSPMTRYVDQMHHTNKLLNSISDIMLIFAQR